MNKKEFLNIKPTIEINIKNWFFNNYKDDIKELKIIQVKIYKYIALVTYCGATCEGFKLINLKTLNVINCNNYISKNINITTADGNKRPGVVKKFTNNYYNTLKMLLNCNKSNNTVSIYNF